MNAYYSVVCYLLCNSKDAVSGSSCKSKKKKKFNISYINLSKLLTVCEFGVCFYKKSNYPFEKQKYIECHLILHLYHCLKILRIGEYYLSACD